MIVFTSLYYDGPISKLCGLKSALDNLFSRHAISRQGAITLPQSAIHALSYAVIGNLDQAAQVHGISDMLFAHSIGPLVQHINASRPGFAKPLEDLEFGQFAHA
jgi:hypothetical protein